MKLARSLVRQRHEVAAAVAVTAAMRRVVSPVTTAPSGQPKGHHPHLTKYTTPEFDGIVTGPRPWSGHTVSPISENLHEWSIYVR